MVSNRNLLFQGSIFRGYVSFREGSYKWNRISISIHPPHLATTPQIAASNSQGLVTRWTPPTRPFFGGVFFLNNVVANLKTPEPNLKTPEPNLKTPEPNLKTPEPNLKTPEPNLKTPEPNLKTPEPNLKIPEPNLKTPEPNLKTPEPNLKTNKQPQILNGY